MEGHQSEQQIEARLLDSLVGGEQETAFTVPAFQGACKQHNSCVVGQLASYRFRNRAGKWQKVSRGLPQEVHNCVLRDALATGPLERAGVCFGTTTGEVYGSIDQGESWIPLSVNLSRIQGVSSFVL